jgi:predicted ATPase
MIESIRFVNYRVLRDTTLRLGPFTLIVGPNGSGKSTALKALGILQNCSSLVYSVLATVGVRPPPDERVEISLQWGGRFAGVKTSGLWSRQGSHGIRHTPSSGPSEAVAPDEVQRTLNQIIQRIRFYALDANAIAASVALQPEMELGSRGEYLAGVLDQLRDRNPERFEKLNEELSRLLPEFDRILFETPSPGARAFLLRTSQGHHAIRAVDLSQGTLLALAILTLAHLPDPPPLVCVEEPDRGIHPRLLLDVRDALYRLSYPDSFGEPRTPVQVLATTHSPYFLDLFRDHPEEIVIAQKNGLEASFERLIDRSDIDEILGDAPLGEVWYSGVLGGVPSK